MRRPSPTLWRPHGATQCQHRLRNSPPTGGNAGVALRGMSLGPSTNGPTALLVDYYTAKGPSQTA